MYFKPSHSSQNNFRYPPPLDSFGGDIQNHAAKMLNSWLRVVIHWRYSPPSGSLFCDIFCRSRRILDKVVVVLVLGKMWANSGLRHNHWAAVAKWPCDVTKFPPTPSSTAHQILAQYYTSGKLRNANFIRLEFSIPRFCESHVSRCMKGEIYSLPITVPHERIVSIRISWWVLLDKW